MSTLTDPISDMLTRIRNAAAVRKQQVDLPHSKIKESVARLLAEKGFIEAVNVEKDSVKIGKILSLKLYETAASPHITEIVRISRPGHRTYVNARNIPVVKRGRGLVIISTSSGLMTGDQAKQQGIGGELICEVY